MTETLLTVLIIAAVIDLLLIGVLTLAVISHITGRRIPMVSAPTKRGKGKKGGETTDRHKPGTIE